MLHGIGPTHDDRLRLTFHPKTHFPSLPAPWIKKAMELVLGSPANPTSQTRLTLFQKEIKNPIPTLPQNQRIWISHIFPTFSQPPPKKKQQNKLRPLRIGSPPRFGPPIWAWPERNFTSGNVSQAQSVVPRRRCSFRFCCFCYPLVI
jgi:hypothetical protein